MTETQLLGLFGAVMNITNKRRLVIRQTTVSCKNFNIISPGVL